MLSFDVLRRSARRDELRLVILVGVRGQAGDHLGDPALDPPALALELERLRIAVGERRIDALEERLRGRRVGGSQEIPDVVDDHEQSPCGGTASAEGIIQQVVKPGYGPRGLSSTTLGPIA